MSKHSHAKAQAATRGRSRLAAFLLVLGIATLVATSPARAGGLLPLPKLPLLQQLVPVQVQASGDVATIRVKLLDKSLTDVTLSFDDAHGLSPSALGVTAQLVTLDAALLSRLPDLQLTQLTNALPLLLTIEPPAGGGLSFDRTVRVEFHTHLLQYTPGTSYRLFKASLGEPFRDITEEISSGSVRARGTTGGFSQFLILADLRETGDVIDAKVDWLRERIDGLPAAEQPAFDGYLDTVEASVASGDFAGAITALDQFRARAANRAGQQLASTWTPGGGARQNHAGELISGAATLKFSVAYLRDYGH